MYQDTPMIKNLLLLFTLLLFNGFLVAQKLEVKSYIINGNKHYSESDYLKAESQYKQALAANEHSIKANYNLGNALYHQNKFDESRAYYGRVIDNENTSKLDKARAYHNIGKSYLDQNKYGEAAQNFKEALKLNPEDDETRYNYALARKFLKEDEANKESSKNKNKTSENQEEQNNDESGQENELKKEGNKDENGENGDGEGESDKTLEQKITKGADGENQHTENDLNKQRLEIILEALKQQEKETLKRIFSNKAQRSKSNTEKDW